MVRSAPRFLFAAIAILSIYIASFLFMGVLELFRSIYQPRSMKRFASDWAKGVSKISETTAFFKFMPNIFFYEF